MPARAGARRAHTSVQGRQASQEGAPQVPQASQAARSENHSPFARTARHAAKESRTLNRFAGPVYGLAAFARFLGHRDFLGLSWSIE